MRARARVCVYQETAYTTFVGALTKGAKFTTEKRVEDGESQWKRTGAGLCGALCLTVTGVIMIVISSGNLDGAGASRTANHIRVGRDPW